MQIKNDSKKEKILLDKGIGLIEHFNYHFVAYNTKFLGYSQNDNYIIRGENSNNSQLLHEFCYGYDDLHHELHLLKVYQTKQGKKYAAIEISNCVYAFWDILE
ncbi:MAG: hypothetical protein J1F66_01780 [Clostridiales bacterium]|nr:hypothetical protein [Clostridiales bacterium]